MQNTSAEVVFKLDHILVSFHVRILGKMYLKSKEYKRDSDTTSPF